MNPFMGALALLQFAATVYEFIRGDKHVARALVRNGGVARAKAAAKKALKRRALI